METILQLRFDFQIRFYERLLLYSLEYCRQAMFVTYVRQDDRRSIADILRATDDYFPKNWAHLHSKIGKFLISSEIDSEWPGTKIEEGDKGLIHRFGLSKDSISVLLQPQSFTAWTYPDWPEDLCLLRHDGSPWLTTVSHEEMVYISFRGEEEQRFLSKFPGEVSVVRYYG